MNEIDDGRWTSDEDGDEEQDWRRSSLLLLVRENDPVGFHLVVLLLDFRST